MKLRIRPHPILFLILALLSRPLAAVALTLPDCAGEKAIGQVHVVRVETDGTLALADGRRVMLEGIRLPGADHPSAVIATQALDALRNLAMADGLILTSTPPKTDRYGRIRVQAFGTVWLQTELLKRGLARVSISPDREECYPDFYEAEIAARDGGRGLWTLPEFAVRQTGSFSASAGSFQVFEGRVINVAGHDGQVFLDFDQDYRKGFSAVIASDDHKAFRNMDMTLEELAGHDVRLRGILENFNGRWEMALSNPRQIEILK